jgi:choline-sulfatase
MRHALAIVLLLGPCSRSSSPAAPEAAAPVVIVDAAPPPAPPPPKRFNVLVITIDSLRADMPWAGYPRPIAPRLQALHDRSIAWTRAYSTSSFTSKSIPGLLTGRFPSELARTGSFFTKYLAPESFACTHLAKEGIHCLGAHAHMYFAAGQSGFESGFETWKIVPGITFDYQTDPYVTSDKLTALATKILENVPDSPFLAWFHYMDPHDQYQGHADAPHFGKSARDLYDEEVFFTDHHIGRLLDFVEQQPWAKNTAIIVTADHGEAFGEHGMTRHAHELWEELVRVPLFVHVPGIAPKSIDVPRGHADVMPTIVDLLGAEAVPPLPGKSLLADVHGAPEERDVIVDLPEDEYNERRRALVHGTTKLIAFGKDVRFALYDLANDPKEKQDLARSQPELLAEMKERYRAASARIVEVAPRGGIPNKK